MHPDQNNTPTIVITSGDPAGIGPELLSSIDSSKFNAKIIILGDRDLIKSRNTHLDSSLEIRHIPIRDSVVAGQLNVKNASYVLELLDTACHGCLNNEFDAMVTAPIQKDIINQAGLSFSGHTEYLAAICKAPKPVMLLATDTLRVALATTHLPLSEIPAAINSDLLQQIISILDIDLRAKFALSNPHIKVCGLNPHAGENGYLGTEEIEIINPLIEKMKHQGINVSGSYPADTVFTKESLEDADVILAMYHDQGLPVLKHAGFNQAINTTLGLPIIRTSVDHGTALHLAGSGKARADSLIAAIHAAIFQVENKN